MKKTYIIPQTNVTKVMMSQMIAVSLNGDGTSTTGIWGSESDNLDNAAVKGDRGGFGDEW